MVSPLEEIFIKMAPESLLRTERRYWVVKGNRPDYVADLSKEIAKRVSEGGGILKMTNVERGQYYGGPLNE